MSLLVVGSMALDSVETPHGKVEEVLGGSSVYFSFAASLFTSVRLVGVVGEDFPEDQLERLIARDIDVEGLETQPGKTFRWSGLYEGNMAEAVTRSVDLNVLGEFDPKIPASYRETPYLFLANSSPDLQIRVLEQLSAPKLAVCDTMNLWIENARDDLVRLLARVDGIVINDGEARMLAETANLPRAAKAILAMGPRFVIIKKGENGAMLAADHRFFAVPAYPTENVIDPTGAGDSFAGGVMGYLASCGRHDLAALKTALLYGTVVASTTVEGFSLDPLEEATREQIDARLEVLKDMVTL